MIKYLILLLFVNTAFSKEKRIKIAVLDSGVSFAIANMKYMCEEGVVAFDGEYAIDTDGHGSNVISAIGENIDADRYCIISYKFFSDDNSQERINNRFTKLVPLLLKEDVRFLNYSAQGAANNTQELNYFKKIIDMGIIISVAAGNHNYDLDKNCSEFPACYARYITSRNYHVVGALSESFDDVTKRSYKTKAYYSNYGNIVNYWESGDWKGMRGTSEATALSLAKHIRSLDK